MGFGLPLQATAPAGWVLFPCELRACRESLICKQNQLITAGNLSSCKAGRQHDCCGAQAQTWLRTGAEQESSPGLEHRGQRRLPPLSAAWTMLLTLGGPKEYLSIHCVSKERRAWCPV